MEVLVMSIDSHFNKFFYTVRSEKLEDMNRAQRQIPATTMKS